MIQQSQPGGFGLGEKANVGCHLLVGKSHANSEKVFEADLRDVVADVLVVHEVAVRIGCFVLADAFGDVGLGKRSATDPDHPIEKEFED